MNDRRRTIIRLCLKMLKHENIRNSIKDRKNFSILGFQFALNSSYAYDLLAYKGQPICHIKRLVFIKKVVR